jgi:disulfide bond formation protein DsbB
MKSSKQDGINFLAICLFSLAIAISLWIEFCCDRLPCVLCFLQRAGMVGSALSFYWNLRFGVHLWHYASAMLWSLFGLSVALRHILLNVCDAPLDDAFYFFSLRVYTWSFLVFFSSLLGTALLLFLYKPSTESASKLLKKLAGYLLLFMAVSCALSFAIS